MDKRMLSAACSGDVSMLHQLLHENPFILSDYTLMNISSTENPLTIATKANQPAFVREILKVNPQLAMEVNQDGVHPLDIASAYGNVEIVREILTVVGPEYCRQPGRDGRSALHYAVMNGKLDIIYELISSCSDCAKDVTTSGETALHLAVKHFKFEALTYLLQWLEKVDHMKEVVNWGDKDGNTVLHYAVSRKQLESVELLVDWNGRAAGNTLQLINAVNKKGLTATDEADLLMDSSNDTQRIRETLRRAGGSERSSDQIHIVSENPQIQSVAASHDHHDRQLPKEKPEKLRDLVELFKFKWGRDSIGEARSTLLVVVTLIATVTFQAGITPPSLLLDKENTNKAAVSIFLVCNTIAFSAAETIVEYLTRGLPFHRELTLALCFMAGAYGFSIGSIGGVHDLGPAEICLVFGSLLLPQLVRWGPTIMKKLGCC